MDVAAHRQVHETPFVVIDLETTGLSPGLDRVVEVSLIRAEAGQDPHLVLDTLLNPMRPMAGTEIHGIKDDHVRAAPRFEAIAEELLSLIDGAVLVSYNVYFDLRFLRYELGRAGYDLKAPHLCAMYMRPLLAVGKRCTLSAACHAMGIDHVRGHWAAADAIATTEIFQKYQQLMRENGIHTFGHLRRGKKYKFLDSLDMHLPSFPRTDQSCPKVSRVLDGTLLENEAGGWAVREYQDVLTVLLADGSVSVEDARWANEQRTRLGVTQEQVRAVHARVFAAAINRCVDDEVIDDAEAEQLRALAEGLRALGWVPGC
jgi:DNA polymerase-3 subunit epsilon